MAIENTREAFLYALGDIYDGENHLLDAQQHMFEHATDAELLGVLRPHIAQTERHVMALEDVFHLLGQEPKGVTSHAASGLGDGARQAIGAARTEALRDYVIAGAAAQVEHFEIASYTALIAEARELDLLSRVEDPLRDSLRQDREMVEALAQLTPRLLRTALRREGARPGDLSGVTEDTAGAASVVVNTSRGSGILIDDTRPPLGTTGGTEPEEAPE